MPERGEIGYNAYGDKFRVPILVFPTKHIFFQAPFLCTLPPYLAEVHHQTTRKGLLALFVQPSSCSEYW